MAKNKFKIANESVDGFTSFTGSDITAYAYMPFLSMPIELGALSFIDISTQRAKAMVTSLGRAGGRGFTRGARVVSGVMSFVQLDRSPFRPLHDLLIQANLSNYGLAQYADELPPFDLVLTYIDEKGDASYRVIETIEIVQEQFRDSIDDVNPQNVFSFVALHVTPLTPFKNLTKMNKTQTNQIIQKGHVITPGKHSTIRPRPAYLPVIQTLKDMIDLLNHKGPETISIPKTTSDKQLGQLSTIIALNQILNLLHSPTRPPIK